ncbi:MAG: ABC transporter permease [Chryseolinea sp.]
MLRNYINVAIRNILKHKFFSFINIIGMTIGISACLLIVIYISNELSYDRFHTDADRIYQVALHGRIAGQEINTSTTCPPMAQALVSDIPEVEAATRLRALYGVPVKNEEKVFTEENVFLADSNFFEFFTFKLIKGDAHAALLEPNTVVITEEMSKKYFADENPVGKLLVIGNDNKAYKVTGVTENPPHNSSFRYNMLLSAISDESMRAQVWVNNFMYTFYRLKPNTTAKQVDAKFIALVEKYVGPEIEKFLQTTIKELKAKGDDYGYYSTALPDLHLHSTTQDNISTPGNISYIYFFAAIGVFIIAIACINFMNLATARSAGRAKEVGLRKTLGSLRTQMIVQFLAESSLYSFVAVILALVACYFLLPAFNELAGKVLTMSIVASPIFILSLIALVFGVGLIAGSYPAFYLTSFNAVDVLKGKVRAGMKSKGIRSTLVVFQFGLSIFLIIFTLVVYQQISFMQDAQLGMDKNNVLVVQGANRLATNKEAFRNSLAQMQGIEKLSYTNNVFPGVNNTTVFRSSGSDQDHIMGLYYADYEHKDVIRFDLKEGRFFSREFPADTMSIILNEAAVKEFGFANPIGEEITFFGGGSVADAPKLKVVGVMKDFNFESFTAQVRPLALRLTTNDRTILVRYSGNPKEAVAHVEKLWKQLASNEPLQYTFLDDNFSKLFRAEQQMGDIFTVFSGLAIFIASLGLFALAAFTSEQRSKEIGIRKVMGASVFGITMLLSREFTRLVLFAFIPAAAAGWFVSNRWLESFAYRIDVNPWTIFLSGFSALVLAWVTVSYQSIRAAAASPAETLRSE